jgi:hypothetical protein
MGKEKKLSRVINKIFPGRDNGNIHDVDGLSRETVFSILLAGVSDLERGLRVLDSQLIISRFPLDILALDLLGELVIIEFELEEDERIILRALEHFDWILNNINALNHKYNKEKIDITLAPRIILISKCFSENFLRKLAYVNTTKIDIYEYELDREDGLIKLKFRPQVFPLLGSKVIEINKPRLEDLVNYIRPIPLRQSCQRMIKEARNLNKDIVLDTASGYIELKRNGTSLVRIYPQPNFFWVNFNPKGRWEGIKIENVEQSEKILNRVKERIG